MAITGLPQASDLIGASGLIDTLAFTLKDSWQSLGRNASGETNTASVQAYAAFQAWAAGLPSNGMAQQAAANWALRHAYDRVYATLAQLLFFSLEDQIMASVPAAWTYLYPASGVYHYLDAHLLRINACHAGVPVRLGSGVSLTLTATTSAGGALPNTASGNCCYVIATLVGTRDIDESVASALSNQVAII